MIYVIRKNFECLSIKHIAKVKGNGVACLTTKAKVLTFCANCVAPTADDKNLIGLINT